MMTFGTHNLQNNTTFVHATSILFLYHGFDFLLLLLNVGTQCQTQKIFIQLIFQFQSLIWVIRKAILLHLEICPLI